MEDEMSEFAVRKNIGSNHHDGEIRDSLAVSNSMRELERRLDQALMETFPASDPVSIVISVTS
jgi:hypothetical protein